MRLCLLAFFTLGLALSAAAQNGPAPEKKQAASEKKVARPAGVPASAVEINEYSWRYTDSQGKVWIYRKTPFGLAKGEQPKPPTLEDVPPGMVAFDAGDSVRFERPTPFGRYKWMRKKGQLDDLEKVVWERDSKVSQPATAPASSAKE